MHPSQWLWRFRPSPSHFIEETLNFVAWKIEFEALIFSSTVEPSSRRVYYLRAWFDEWVWNARYFTILLYRNEHDKSLWKKNKNKQTRSPGRTHNRVEELNTSHIDKKSRERTLMGKNWLGFRSTIFFLPSLARAFRPQFFLIEIFQGYCSRCIYIFFKWYSRSNICVLTSFTRSFLIFLAFITRR